MWLLLLNKDFHSSPNYERSQTQSLEHRKSCLNDFFCQSKQPSECQRNRENLNMKTLWKHGDIMLSFLSNTMNAFQTVWRYPRAFKENVSGKQNLCLLTYSFSWKLWECRKRSLVSQRQEIMRRFRFKRQKKVKGILYEEIQNMVNSYLYLIWIISKFLVFFQFIITGGIKTELTFPSHAKQPRRYDEHRHSPGLAGQSVSKSAI